MDPFRPASGLLFGRPSPSLRTIVIARAFAFGSVLHLLLPDAEDWVAPNIVYVAGILLLAWNGCAAGWALSAVGLAIPLLFHEDQLTQSGFLLLTALAALGAILGGRAADRTERVDRAFPLALRLLTAGAYMFAALHKTNRDFLDPQVSCATGGIHILAENWSLPFLDSPELRAIYPRLFLATEAGLAVLLVARPGAALVLGVIMHIPLTLVFDEAFVFTVMPGWLAFLGDEELRWLGEALKKRWRIIVPLGVAPWAVSVGLYFRDHWVPYPAWFAKELCLWLVLAWLVVAWWRRPPGVFGWGSAWREGIPKKGRALALAVALVWIGNGLTPYLGLQFHHAAAMLSNLRVDRGCWNSLVFPESMRIRDPYVRIERAEVGGVVRGRRDLQGYLVERLWSVQGLWQARARICAEGAAPVRIAGQHDGRSFEVDDLCARFPFEPPLLPGYRGFQVNLSPDCPQRCVH